VLPPVGGATTHASCRQAARGVEALRVRPGGDHDLSGQHAIPQGKPQALPPSGACQHGKACLPGTGPGAAQGKQVPGGEGPLPAATLGVVVGVGGDGGFTGSSGSSSSGSGTSASPDASTNY
jgi:hypothetical protein